MAVVLAIGSCTQSALSSNPAWRVELDEGTRRLAAQDLSGSEACLRQALKDLERSRSRNADDLSLCQRALAAVLVKQDITEEAIRLYKRSLRVLDKEFGKESPKLIPSTESLGEIYEGDGDYKKAAKYYARAASIAESGTGSNSLVLSRCRHKLGRALARQGSLRAAEDLYRSSLSALLSQNSLSSAEPLLALLSDYMDLIGKVPEKGKGLASKFQSELLKDQIGSSVETTGAAPSMWSKEVSARLQRAKLDSAGENNESLQPDADGRAATIVPNRQPPDFAALERINAQRIDFYERMIAVDIEALGPNHPSVARDLSGLAALYMTQRSYDHARPLLERALSIYRANYGPDARLVRSTQSLLELISAEQNAGASTNAPLDSVISGLPRVPLQAQSLEVALRLNDLAFLLYSHGRMADAERSYGWALASIAGAAGEHSPLFGASLVDYARVLRSLGRKAAADQMDECAQAIFRRALTRQAARALP